MLIIFDLDDTLIDTSGCVTPFKMKECIRVLFQHGLRLKNLYHAYEELMALNKKSARSKDAIEKFIIDHNGSPSLIPIAIDTLTLPLPVDFLISTTPHAKKVLKNLLSRHILVIVTGGHPPFQLEKLEKAGIDKAIFSKIAIPEDSVKKPFYEGIVREFSIPPSQILVCGDRIAMDLLPGFELGFQTVHMRWGRGKMVETEQWINHSISELTELQRIVQG